MFLMNISQNLSSTFNTGKKYILDDEIAVRGPIREVALNILLAAGKTWKSPLPNNPEAVNYFSDTTVQANYLNNATTVRLVSTVAKPIKLRPGSIIKNITTGDTLVLSASTSDITISAGVYVQAANVTGVTAAGTAGDICILLEPTRAEDADFDTDDSVISTITKYATQVFQKGFALSGTAQAIEDMIANGDARYEEQKERVLAQLESKLLTHAFWGTYAISGANSESGYPATRAMGGIIDSFTRAGGSITNLGGAITLDVLSGYAAELNELKVPMVKGDDYTGSEAQHVIFVPGKTRRKFNFLNDAGRPVTRSQDDKIVKTGVTTVELAGRYYDIVTVPINALPEGYMVMMHKGQYQLGPLQNSDFAVKEIETANRGNEWGLHGEFGGVMKFANAAKVVKGITFA